MLGETAGRSTSTSVCEVYVGGKNLDMPYPRGAPIMARTATNTHRLRNMLRKSFRVNSRCVMPTSSSSSIPFRCHSSVSHRSSKHHATAVPSHSYRNQVSNQARPTGGSGAKLGVRILILHLIGQRHTYDAQGMTRVRPNIPIIVVLIDGDKALE